MPLLRWRIPRQLQIVPGLKRRRAEREERLGWGAYELFGCRPTRPLEYLGIAGLLWAVNGGRIVELRRDWATVEHPRTGKQITFTQRRTRGASLVLPWNAARP